jgi:Skp family chaperone for outer membrane proteins
VADVDYLMNQSAAAKDIKKQLAEKRQEFRAEFQSIEENLQAEERALVEQRNELSQTQFQAKAQAFRQDLSEQQERLQQRRAALDEAFSDALQKLQVEIGQLIQATAREEGLDFVFAKQQVLFAAKGQRDLTQTLLERLDQKVTTIQVEIDAE